MAGKNGIHRVNSQNYPLFKLAERLTQDQKDFFEKYGFVHFKSFIDRKRIVQRFAFANHFSPVLKDLLGDPRLKALFELIGSDDCRIGENEKDGLVFNHYVNTKESNYSQLGWHTEALREIFYGNKIMPMLN